MGGLGDTPNEHVTSSVLGRRGLTSDPNPGTGLGPSVCLSPGLS